MRWIGWLALAGAALSAAPAFAHHSQGAVYDQSRLLAVQGTLSRIDVQNPHSMLELTILTGDGQSIVWLIEGKGVEAMNRVGFSPATVRIGDKVTVTGSPAWALDHRLWLFSVQTSRGRTFNFGGGDPVVLGSR